MDAEQAKWKSPYLQSFGLIANVHGFKIAVEIRPYLTGSLLVH
jgi:hypothetical protein